jgi:hypothetical protein
LVDRRLPQPPVAQALTIQDGEVTKHSIIACDNPSKEYPENLCEPISYYYRTLGIYTIEELFEIADVCLSQTRVSISKCSTTVADEFQDFPNAKVMFDTLKTCEAEFEYQDSFCAVEYDPYYGYPKDIFLHYLSFEDGYSTIIVKSFQITQ